MIISEKIRASGVSDLTISEATGLSVSSVWRWRQGLTNPNIAHISALARVLKCKPADLIPKETR